MNIELKKKYVDSWFNYLQSQICNQFELLEKELSPKPKNSQKENGQKIKKEGGGVSYLLKNGKIFDKVGVNKSTVSGKFAKEFRSRIFRSRKKRKLLGLRCFGCRSHEKSQNTCSSF